ncbi:MAG: tRNA lysidine(34) synthetase TilS [Chthoniobacterales bacterium]
MSSSRMRQKRASDADWDSEVLQHFSTQERYLVAVSGGRDSVALLHWLLSKGYSKLIVCHLDHRLRGRSSTADARFVEHLALDAGLRFFAASADVRLLARKTKRSTETAARNARYDFFAAAAVRHRCRTIFLAHHSDDLVETFLFNLFRGGGGRSMRAVSLHTIGKTSLTLVRPLLHVWRDEIDQYVRSQGLRFREDASNASLDPARNRMRHRIIPGLEKEFGRAIRKAIWRAALIASEEDALLATMLPNDLLRREKLRVNSLRQQPVALQRRAIRAWLRQNGVADIGFELIERVRSLLGPTAGPAKVNLPEERYARRRAGELFLEEPSHKLQKGRQR